MEINPILFSDYDVSLSVLNIARFYPEPLPMVHTAPSMPRKKTRPHARPDALAFTVSEVRQIGGPGRTKLYELIKSGELQTITIGHRRLICGDALRTLLRGVAAT